MQSPCPGGRAAYRGSTGANGWLSSWLSEFTTCAPPPSGCMASGTVSPSSPRMAGCPAAVSCGSPWDRCARGCVSPHGIRSRTAALSSQEMAGCCGSPPDQCAAYCASPGDILSGGAASPCSVGIAGRSGIVYCASPSHRRAEDCGSPGDMSVGTTPPSSWGIPGGAGSVFGALSPDRYARDCASPPFTKWALVVRLATVPGPFRKFNLAHPIGFGLSSVFWF
jgi:hypothetical protein